MQLSTTVSDLGVLVDSQLSMADHVASLCQSCFFQLHQLRLMRSSLTDDSAKTLVHTLVSSRLDYCNSVLYSVSGRLLRKLQTVQNATARVVTRSRKFNLITPVLNELHWLPMVQSLQFKLALIVFKCLHGLAPSYLTDDCVLVSSMAGRRLLRSADTRTLYVPRTRTAIGARNFAVAGPRVWNSLLPELQMLNCTVCTNAAKLKTFLFLAVSVSENF